ncbi:hypothetical protein [Pseudogemmobacter sp. W21_MBD1_M6]|uniref:hypothetical protein n=1 Tax=Pseudogemmobacter sp. W21_MBD1_M6 TaxID=3240271 RepID=UPI003F9B0627
MADPRHGIGAVIGAEDGLEAASLIEAANICDEAVPLIEGGAEPRYACNGVVTLSTVLDAQGTPSTVQTSGLYEFGAGLVLLGLEGALPALLPWIGAALFVGVIIYAVRARSARIEDYRTGRSPGSGHSPRRGER